MKTGYVVRDIMTNQPITMDDSITVKECAEVMSAKHVGSVLVMKKAEIRGIVTEKDIVMRLVAKGLDAEKTLLKEIMSKRDEMVVIEPGKDLYDAIIEMKDNNVRRLPVIENGKLKGLLTINDVLKIEPDLFDIMVEKIDIREEERKFDVINSNENMDEEL